MLRRSILFRLIQTDNRTPTVILSQDRKTIQIMIKFKSQVTKDEQDINKDRNMEI